MITYTLPFILQGSLMAVDEFYFHERRGLPNWEKIGHPLDTLTTLIPLVFPIFFQFNYFSKSLFIIFAIFSCLFITKDEFIHRDICSKEELWLHALLFVLHPIVFLSTYLMWSQNEDHLFLLLQPSLIFVFLLYQIFRWSSYGEKLKNK